jgi:hypothetical protein
MKWERGTREGDLYDAMIEVTEMYKTHDGLVHRGWRGNSTWAACEITQGDHYRSYELIKTNRGRVNCLACLGVI